MVEKPEVATPTENKPAETFKAMSTAVATIRVFEEVKTFSTHEYPTAPKHVDVKTNGIGEVMTLGRKSPKILESENSSSEKLLKVGLMIICLEEKFFPLYLRMINLIFIILPSLML